MRDLLKHKNTRRILALSIIVLLAAGIELGYVAARQSSLTYTRADYVAADFTVQELEYMGNDQYHTLANSSYYLIENLDGGAVQTIEIHMTRDPNDITDTVLYIRGTVNGVSGEFPVAMQKISEGIYLATPNAESVSEIRIYPTKSVHAPITFHGITLNPSVSIVSYSVSRILLWGFLVAFIYYLYQFLLTGVKKLRNRKKGKTGRLKTGVSPWSAAYVMIGATILLVTFQATQTFTTVRGAESILLPLAFAAYSLLYLIVWLLVVRIQKIESKLFTLVLVVGILFSFANAPLQAPDEYVHFMRAYTLSRGQLVFDYNFVFPDDVQHLVRQFPAEMNNEIRFHSYPDVASSIQTYMDIAQTPYTEHPYATSIQVVVPYIPAALGIAAARLFGANALMCLYAARICNVVLLALCAYAALKMAARYRGALIAMALLPMTLFMGASTSYDSMFLAAVLLFAGFAFKEEFYSQDLLYTCLLMGIILSIKPVYLPLVLLLLLIPKDAFHTKIPRWLCVLIAAGVGMMLYTGTMLYASAFSREIPPQVPLDGVDMLSQFQYIFSNPIRYLLVLAIDAYTKVAYLNTFGRFGWLDLDAALTNFLTPVLLFVVGALYADTARFYKKGDKWVHAITTVLMYGIIVTGFYLTWSTLGSTTILGVQSRYFIPIVPCFIALISKALSPVLRFREAVKQREDMRDAVCVYICGGVACVGAMELALGYFLM